jgi:hypothetical protein
MTEKIDDFDGRIARRIEALKALQVTVQGKRKELEEVSRFLQLFRDCGGCSLFIDWRNVRWDIEEQEKFELRGNESDSYVQLRAEIEHWLVCEELRLKCELENLIAEVHAPIVEPQKPTEEPIYFVQETRVPSRCCRQCELWDVAPPGYCGCRCHISRSSVEKEKESVSPPAENPRTEEELLALGEELLSSMQQREEGEKEERVEMLPYPSVYDEGDWQAIAPVEEKADVFSPNPLLPTQKEELHKRIDKLQGLLSTTQDLICTKGGWDAQRNIRNVGEIRAVLKDIAQYLGVEDYS